MAKKFSTLLLAVILFSCSKKIEDSQLVTYTVKCDYCGIELADTKQVYVVKEGTLVYTTPKTDTTGAKVFVSVFSPLQKIDFRIQSGKNKVEFTGYLGHNPDVFKESFFDKYLSL
jgi:spore coat polysaccharide biosynthesis protein SpsF (cytidylyltransferase family)